MSTVVRGRTTTPTTRDCARCRRRGLSAYTFRRADPDQRNAWRTEGLVRLEARGLCQSCYRWATTHDRLVDYERANRPAAELREEWEHLADPLLPIRTECRRLAAQFGMHWRDLERAVSRAGIRSRFEPAHRGGRVKAAA